MTSKKPTEKQQRQRLWASMIWFLSGAISGMNFYLKLLQVHSLVHPVCLREIELLISRMNQVKGYIKNGYQK